MASEQLVVFRLRNEEYAVSIASVKEIVNYTDAIKLPNTPEHLEGIINLRAKVIPVVNLAKWFSQTQEQLKGTKALIVEAAGREVGVIVDEVTEVLRVDDNAIDPVPQACCISGFVRGIGKLDGRLLIILDLNRLFSEEEQLQLAI